MHYAYKRLDTPGHTVVLKRIRITDEDMNDEPAMRVAPVAPTQSSPPVTIRGERAFHGDGIFRREDRGAHRSFSSSNMSLSHRRSKGR